MLGRDIGRYCIFKIEFLAVNPTSGVLRIRVATLRSDRLKGSEGREGVKTLWSALAEFRCRWDSRLLGGQVSLVVYEDLIGEKPGGKPQHLLGPGLGKHKTITSASFCLLEVSH